MEPTDESPLPRPGQSTQPSRDTPPRHGSSCGMANSFPHGTRGKLSSQTRGPGSGIYILCGHPPDGPPSPPSGVPPSPSFHVLDPSNHQDVHPLASSFFFHHVTRTAIQKSLPKWNPTGMRPVPAPTPRPKTATSPSTTTTSSSRPCPPAVPSTAGRTP